MLKTVFFDFDGTIADTYPLVIDVLRGIAREENIEFPDEDVIESLRGMGVREMFKTLHIPLRKLPVIFKETRSRLQQRIAEAKPYDGVEDMLLNLEQQGMKTVILSSNTQEIVDAFLDQHSLPKFDAVHGYGRIFGKGRPLKKLTAFYDVDHTSAVYVGDEIRDIEAAKHAHIPAVAVTWGFNTEKILLDYKPDYVTRTPQELLKLLKDL